MVTDVQMILVGLQALGLFRYLRGLASFSSTEVLKDVLCSVDAGLDGWRGIG